MSLRIAIDMDDTLVDTHHYLLQRCRTDLGINLNDKIFEGVDFFDALPERDIEMKSLCSFSKQIFSEISLALKMRLMSSKGYLNNTKFL